MSKFRAKKNGKMKKKRMTGKAPTDPGRGDGGLVIVGTHRIHTHTYTHTHTHTYVCMHACVYDECMYVCIEAVGTHRLHIYTYIFISQKNRKRKPERRELL